MLELYTQSLDRDGWSPLFCAQFSHEKYGLTVNWPGPTASCISPSVSRQPLSVLRSPHHCICKWRTLNFSYTGAVIIAHYRRDSLVKLYMVEHVSLWGCWAGGCIIPRVEGASSHHPKNDMLRYSRNPHLSLIEDVSRPGMEETSSWFTLAMEVGLKMETHNALRWTLLLLLGG